MQMVKIKAAYADTSFLAVNSKGLRILGPKFKAYICFNKDMPPCAAALFIPAAPSGLYANVRDFWLDTISQVKKYLTRGG